jgi:hypothetical protein
MHIMLMPLRIVQRSCCPIVCFELCVSCTVRVHVLYAILVQTALSIQPKTPSQWESEGHKIIPSPACMGGPK